jgi:transcriptional regulator with XRE-family HTH domain
MFIPNRIEQLLEERKVTKVYLASQLGISIAGLKKMIAGNSLPSVDKVEKIADFFKVPMDFFFDRGVERISVNIGHQVSGTGNITGNISLNECQKELGHLQEIIKEKDKIIDEKERLIRVLMDKK